MTIWSGEIKELHKLYGTFKGHNPDIVKEMEQLIKTDDSNVVLLYSRRCLEVIVPDLCETELKRPRKTEPLKGDGGVLQKMILRMQKTGRCTGIRTGLLISNSISSLECRYVV